MTCIAVRCPHCHSDQIVTRGTTARGTQRHLCQNAACAKGRFLLDDRHRGCVPEVKHTIMDMSLTASGVRDTARVLPISADIVRNARRKKDTALESVHTALLCTLHPEEVTVDIERASEAEREERWSCVRHTHHPRWLWHAMDQQTGKVLASVFGRRKEEVFLTLPALLEPCGLPHDSPDTWGASTRHLDPEQHTASTRSTQKIARQHLT